MFNTQRAHVVATIPVGTRPVGVAVNVHDQVFVTNSGDSTVSVIDSRTNTVSTTLHVGPCPEAVATDPQFGACVANAGNNSLSVLDRFNAVIATIDCGGPSHSPFGPPPHAMGVAVDHFMARAYVTGRAHNKVSIIGISGDLPPFAFDFIDVQGPLGVAVDSVHHRVYVTRPDFNQVSVIDGATKQVIGTIPVRQCPTGIAVAPQGRPVYVANSGFNTVSVIDIAAGGISDIEVGAGPMGVTVDPQGDAYVTRSDGTVQVIDAESGTVTARVPVGSQPEGVAFEPHSNRIYVANTGDGTVSAIDLARS